MQNFDYQTPTRLIFGKGVVKNDFFIPDPDLQRNRDVDSAFLKEITFIGG